MDNLEVSRQKIIRRILWGGIAVVMILPLVRSVNWEQGILKEWACRVEELSKGTFALFPTAQVYFDSGVRDNALNSNLFFSFSALLLRLTGSLFASYRVTMGLIQVATMVFAKLFFDACFGKKEPWAAFFGAFLYVTCPYRWFMAYHQGDLSMTLGWALLPLYAWAVLRLSSAEKGKWFYVLAGAAALAGIGYAHFVLFGTAAAFTCLWAICRKKPMALFSVAGGSVLFLPGLHQLGRLAFSNIYDVWDLVGCSIMPKGYRLGDYFNVYAFREGHPGMGLGLMIGLGAMLWLRFVEGRKAEKDVLRFFPWVAALLCVLSFRAFPWEWVQRMGAPFLRLVGAIGTPATFWGLACGCLCVPAGRALGMLVDGLDGKKA